MSIFYKLNDPIQEFPLKFADHCKEIINNPNSKSEIASRYAPTPSLNCPITLLVIGILVAIGGLFILAASNQLLPSTPNVISELCITGKAIAYSTLVLGIILKLCGFLHYFLALHKRARWENEVYHLEIYKFAHQTIHTNEIFVVDDPLRETRTYFYEDPKNKGVLQRTSQNYSSDPNAHQQFLNDNGLQNKSPVTIGTLKSRYK